MLRYRRGLFILLLISLAIILAAGCGSQEAGTSEEPDVVNEEAAEAEGSEAGEEKEAEGEVITLSVGHVAPPNHSYTIGLENFAQEVEEATGGRITFDIFGGGQLGGEREMVEQIQLGSLDMGLITSGPVGNFVPELNVLEMPFLFEDLDHVYATLDGEIGEELLQKMGEQGFKGLGIWENGFRHLSNNKREIRSPEDLKGLVMRTIENDVFVATYRALGADPTPIAWPEVYTSLQQGVIDGFDASYGVFASTNMFEVQDHFSEVGIYYASAILLMNQELFESFPADIQEILDTLGREHAVKQREINQEMEAEQRALMEKHGVKILNREELDIQPFAEAVQSVYDRYGAEFGDYIDRIKAVAEQN